MGEEGQGKEKCGSKEMKAKRKEKDGKYDKKRKKRQGRPAGKPAGTGTAKKVADKTGHKTGHETENPPENQREQGRLWTLCEAELASEGTDLKECYRFWCEDISRYAKEAWTETVERYRLSGRMLAKAETDQRLLRYCLWKNLEGKKT